MIRPAMLALAVLVAVVLLSTSNAGTRAVSTARIDQSSGAFPQVHPSLSCASSSP